MGYSICLFAIFGNFNGFPSKGFPIDEENRLALDRVKSISSLSADWAVKGLVGSLRSTTRQ